MSARLLLLDLNRAFRKRLRALLAQAFPTVKLEEHGVVLFEMLTGRQPYTGRTPREIFLQHIHAPVLRLQQQLANYQLLLDRLLAKREKDRMQSAAELLYLLDEYWPEAAGGN